MHYDFKAPALSKFEVEYPGSSGRWRGLHREILVRGNLEYLGDREADEIQGVG